MSNNICHFTNDFKTQSTFLKSFAYKLTKDYHKAEDLFQDTALLAYRNKDKYIMGTNLKAWLCTIMRNTFINNFRRKKRQGIIIDSDLAFQPESGITHNEGESELVAGELIALIDTLDDHLKQPFVMAYHGYKYQEISEVMNLPLGTIKSRVFLARKVLKKQIKAKFRVSEAADICYQ